MKDSVEVNEPGIKQTEDKKLLDGERKETGIDTDKKKSIPRKTTEIKSANTLDNEKKSIKKSTKKNAASGEAEQAAKKISKKKNEAEPEKVTKKKSAQNIAEK